MEELLAFLKENGLSDEVLEQVRQMAQSQLDAQGMEQAMDNELLRAGAKNLTAVKSLINRDGITYEGGKLNGMTEMLKQLRTECGYLFGGNGMGYQPQGGSAPPDLSQMNDREYFDYIKAQAKNR